MIFKLTEEQISEIIELYGGSRKKINEIEAKLNLSGLVRLEEDYYELIAAIVSQIESIKQQLKNVSNMYDKIRLNMSLDEIIYAELTRKYDNLENEKIETQIQFRKIFNVK